MVRFLRRLGFLIVLSFFVIKGSAQPFNPKQKKLYKIFGDTLVLDSLSLVPGSVNFSGFSANDSTEQPTIDYKNHAIIFHGKKPDSILVSYQRFPYNFEKEYFHKDPNALYTDFSRPNNPFTIRYDNTQQNLLQNDGLTKNGNISRGISFGNNQDVVLNSNLNLQVSGKLTPEIDLVMAATDNNIPFQADGTTAQLQEFDKVYIQLSNYNTKMIVGDYQLSRPQNSYFMNFYKRAQGLYLENSYQDSAAKKPLIFKTQVSGAVSRGKFSRQIFFGTEGNQGPYRLRGADNEPFIIILSGTEKIYIDGKLLQRGQENDYIIDYNTGELTFTARQLITKDKRIVAEFQYAERNYSRSLFFFGEEVQTKNARFYFNAYNEQDNKNRPLQQQLSQDQKISQEQKNVLIGVGDSLNDAVYSGVAQVPFNRSDVFYKKTDTLVNGFHDSIFVYSTDSVVAKYRLTFSNVGTNKGNYIQISSAANGKVYQWIAPVNGIPQGNYEPVIPLVTPKQSQMLTGGVSYSLTQNNSLNVEGVYTKNDVNKFSTKDKGNDEGSGVKLSSRNQTVIREDSLKQQTKLIYNVNYEFVQQRFKQIERFRSIEFDRDWNRPLTGVLKNDQSIASAELGLMKNANGILYSLNLFNEGKDYEGLRHNVTANYQDKKFSGNYSGAYLTTQDKSISQNSNFYRHKTLLSQKIKRVKIAYNDEFENNIFVNSKNDSLRPNAYQFWEWEGSISNADSSKNNVKVFYRERRDKLAYSDRLQDSTFARNIGFQTSIYSIKNNPFTVLVTYRNLELKRNNMNLKPDNTLLNRVEYNPRWFKGLITSNAFYETGYGMQNKQEFYYLQVAAGQGQYAWNDYNGNGIKEVNEFEIAQFKDQAQYIRIYTPTNQYQKVLQNQMSVSLNVRPASLWRDTKNEFVKFVNRWSLQTALRIDNKIKDTVQTRIKALNPFATVADTFLLGANNNLRQSVFFNQTSAVFGADYTYTENKSVQLLTYGLEAKTLYSHEVKWRFNFFKAWSINSSNTTSVKGNNSKFFASRNYHIKGLETEQTLIFQPNTIFRISGIYKYGDKQNTIKNEYGNFQQAYINTVAMELKYNQTEKGSLTGRVDYINISYNDDTNSSVAYEMLNGLQTGNNFTWELTYQRNIGTYVQISINYSGRKTPNTAAVHLGGAQVRAFF
ncbi:MAG: hypothetical protein KF900_14475 [Bacteroidetes bacterium]|nr:hypothetical protein [Bacteroidota bacterium]